MSSKLKIYACSGIGSTDSEYRYWTDNTNCVSNTQAENNLLAMINQNYAEASYLRLSTEEVAKRLDNIDLYCVCLNFAQVYADQPDMLHTAGQVVSQMVADGMFEFGSVVSDERDANLDMLLDHAERLMQADVKEDPVFMKWWKDEVEDLNKVGLTANEQNAAKKALAKDGVSAVDYGNDDLNVMLNDASEYFLYTYFTDAQIEKLPKVFKRKRKTQKNCYQHCLSLYKDINGTESAMKSIIESGIIEEFGARPEEVTQSIYDKYMETGSVGVPIATEIAVAIITAVFSFVTAMITLIIQAVVKVKVAEAESIDEAALAAATPDEGDYAGFDLSSLSSSSKNWLLYGAAAVAAFLFLRNKNK